MPAKVVKMKVFFTFMHTFDRLILPESMTENPNKGELFREQLLFAIIYLVAVSIILPFTLWYVNNPDAFQYISITEKLKAGHLYYAINGYWGPLLSWLMLIPVWLGVNSVIAFKIVQIVIGLFALHAWHRLSLLSGIGKNYRILFCFTVIPFLVSYALLNLTADLLFLCLTLYVIIELSKGRWLITKRSAVWFGLMGAAMYYAKAFGFPLFLTFLTMAIIASSVFYKSKISWINAGIVLASFILTSSFWIVTLSIKYGDFTISRAASFNMSKEVAPLPGKIMHLPVLNGPLIAPADEFACSAWESPGEVIKTHPLRPISSPDDRDYYLQVIKRNLLSIWYYDFRNQAGILFAGILLIFLVSGKARAFREQAHMLMLLLVVFIFYGAYSLILVHTRYVWICTGLMILLSAWMLDSSGTKSEWKKKFAWLLFIFMILLSVKRPLKEILFSKDYDVPLLWFRNAIFHPFDTLKITYRADKHLHAASKELKKFPELSGRLASLMSDDADRHGYSASLFIASQTGAVYYGPVKNDLPSDSVKAELFRHGISAFLVWNKDRWSAGKEDWVQLFYEDDDSGLSVFRILSQDNASSEQSILQ